MTVYVLRHGKFVEKSQAEPLAAPQVISDTMEPTRHMANGRYYDSKQQFRAATKAAGCIEYGNEVQTLLTPRKPAILSRTQRREAIRHAIYDLRGRRG